MSMRNLKPECEEALHQIYEYIDGELTAEKREEIKRHLDECPPCVDAKGLEDKLRHLLATKCRDECPDALKARIADALRAVQS